MNQLHTKKKMVIPTLYRVRCWQRLRPSLTDSCWLWGQSWLWFEPDPFGPHQALWQNLSRVSYSLACVAPTLTDTWPKRDERQIMGLIWSWSSPDWFGPDQFGSGLVLTSLVLSWSDPDSRTDLHQSCLVPTHPNSSHYKREKREREREIDVLREINQKKEIGRVTRVEREWNMKQRYKE